MKKITLFIFLLSFSFSFSQVVLSEDFEAGTTIPAGWTNNDIAAAGDTWTIESSGTAALAGSNDLVYSIGGAEGNYATFDSDVNSDNSLAEDVALESPVFSCAALTQVSLEYNHLFAGDYGGGGFVEVSANGGTSWTTVQEFSADGYQGGLISIDVTTELAGVTNAQIRFRWTGDWSVAWYLDNISVFECTDSTPNPVITPGPADGATDVALDNSDNNFPNRLFFTWADGAGDPGTSYTLNLGDESPPTDNSFANFPNGDFIFNLLDNTTYFWSIESTNCAGTSTPTIWSFTTGAPLSIEDNELSLINVYPNPTKGIIKIDTNLIIDNISIVNQLGQSVMQLKNEDIINNEVNLSTLSNGLYFMNISSEDKSQTIKIIKE